MSQSKKVILLKNEHYLFHENDYSKELYVLQKGKLLVYRMEGYKKINLGEIVPGGVLGEMAAMDDRPRSASALALEDSELIIITKQDFEKALHEIPSWFQNIVKIVVQRLRKANKRIDANIIKNNISNIANMLVFLFTKFKDDKNSIDLKMAKKEIVEMLNVAHHDLEKVFNEFIKNRLMRIDQNRIVIDKLEELEQYARYIRNRDEGKEFPHLNINSLKVLNFFLSLAEKEDNKEKNKIVIDIESIFGEIEKLIGKQDEGNKNFLDELIRNDLITLEKGNERGDKNVESQFINEVYKGKNIVFIKEKIEDVVIFSKFKDSFKHKRI